MDGPGHVDRYAFHSHGSGSGQMRGHQACLVYILQLAASSVLSIGRRDCAWLQYGNDTAGRPCEPV